MTINLLILLFLICLLLLLTFFFLRQSYMEKYKSEKQMSFEIDVICHSLNDYFSEYMNTWYDEKKLGECQIKKLESLQSITRKALHECNLGNLSAKIYIKEQIREWLLNIYGITKENINQVIPFDEENKLSDQDMFEIILHYYKKESGADAFDLFLRDNYLTPEDLAKQFKNQAYCITKQQIEQVYQSLKIKLNFMDKLDIVIQRIYQVYKGHGVIDELRDMNIDGLSGGVSGSIQKLVKAGEEEMPVHGIWVFYHGLMMHLEFLSFASYEELQKVCRNIYRYGKPGQLSAVKGYIVNEMMDGSRVVVVRPPFAESWSFFVRKFEFHGIQELTQLFPEEGFDSVLLVLKLLIMGEQIIGVTGEQGSGKTTLLKSLIQFISPNYTLRVQELVFELHLREIYPDRNIVSFRETAEISGREALDLQKKTDGTVNIIGEVANPQVASWLVMISQVASKFTLFTHHAKTTQSLVYSLRNDLMITGAFHKEEAAMEQVKMSIRFDVHMAKDETGHRYIERISEIVPQTEQIVVNDLVRYQNGRYCLLAPMSDITKKEIKTHLDRENAMIYDNLFEAVQERRRGENIQ